MAGEASIPGSVDELTPAWFSAVLGADVEGVELLDAHSGTTGRAKVRLQADSSVPDTLFVKLQPFDQEQREFLRMVGLGVSEAKLYAAVGEELPVRVPKVWHAACDEADDSFVMVLEDLEASGCRFATPDDDDALAVAESLVEELAELHARYWGQELPWLGSHALSPGDSPEAQERMAMGASIVQMALDQFADELPDEFRTMGELYIARNRDIGSLWNEGERTLIHGDDHIGNLFVDAGRTGFYDWAVASQYPGTRDVAYFLCNSLPTEVRRREEDALLARYLSRLVDLGVALDADVAHEQYRLFSVYSWIAATTTAAMGSRWQPVEVGRRATERTTQALIDLDVLGLLDERLGDALSPTRSEVIAGLTAPGGMFELGQGEVGGVRMGLWATAPASLRDLLEGTRKHGDRDFLVFGDARYTYAEHLGLVAGLAQWLATERGVGKGDRVAIAMRNYPEWIVSFWATQALGAVAVPLNAWWTAPELRYGLEDSGSALAIVDGERYERLAGDLTDLGVPSIVVRHDDDLGAGGVHWADVAAAVDRTTPLPDVELAPDDDATIVYTSGTTGEPKGAVGTHRNHVSTFLNTAFSGAVGAMLAASSTRRRGLPPCSLMTYPFFHIGGLNTIYISTGFGVKMVLQFKWDLEEALELIQREQVTSLAAVPTLLRQVLESPLLDQYDVSSLGTLASGGAPVPPDLVDRIDRKFASGVAPSNGYGLTETTGAVTLNVGREYVDRSASVGQPFPVTEVGVVDPDSGDAVPTGTVGELWFRGPTVARGYWNKPEATAVVFTDGWFHTGDLGFVDDEGYVHVVDRLKDVIIRGGENVYCAEVEAALFEHPAVADVAVLGVPHHELGEEVAAIVLRKDGATASASDLQEHVAARLAYFKVPAHVVFRTEPLPRTATGKVLKRALRDQLDPGVKET